MKIRNVVFSGFAAAIFAGVCGTVDAATVNLVKYETYTAGMESKQDKLKVGENISIAEDNTISATGVVTTAKLTEVQTALEQAIQAMHENGDYATAKQLEDLAAEVEKLKGSSASNEVIAELTGRVKAIEDAPYAKESFVTDAVNGVKTLLNDYAKSVDVNTALELKANTADLAAVATTGSYTDLKDIPTDLVKQSGLERAVLELQDLIDDKADADDYLVAADLTALNEAVAALQSGKADASTVETLQETVANLGNTYATDAEVAAAVAAVEGKIPSLAEYAKTAEVAATYATKEALADVKTTADAAAAKSYVDEELAKKADADASYTKAESDDKYLIMQDANALGENLQWVDGKLDTKGIATADGLAELETKVNNAAQKTDVANDIAQALADAKKYADDNDADTLYDDAQVKADIAANAAAIELKANSADVYTKAEVDSAIDAIEEYDDTALAGRVTANETAISANADAIDAIETKTDALKALAYKDTVATGDIDNNAVTTAKIAGQAAQAGEMMMMTAGEDGVATWTAVRVY